MSTAVTHVPLGTPLPASSDFLISPEGRMLRAVVLLGIGIAAAVPAARVRPGESGAQSRDDAAVYFAGQQEKLGVDSLENFEARHADQFARGALPCDDASNPSFSMQCASVSRAARTHGQKFKTASKGSSKLFTEKFRPEDSRHFKVQDSSTFTAEVSKTFDLHYADGSHLRGFTGNDQVTMGDYNAHSPFGVITDCNSPDFNGVDGILGFGLPRPGSDMPTPILFAMTDPSNPESNAQELKRKFSFFSTDDAAEVQLGGYDPDTTSGTMWYTPALSQNDFIVGVNSLKFGGSFGASVELLQFKSETQRKFGAPSIMDSGTSCLVIPGDKMNGQLSNVPWDDFARNWGKDKSFWLEIGQKTWEIPFNSWYLEDTEQTCVQPSPDGMQGLLVGDVFFREYVVEFDMTDSRPIIGIAPLNKLYKPVAKNQLANYELHQAPKAKLSLLKGEEIMYPAEHSETLTAVDRIPIVNQKGTQYFMDVSVGTPAQPFTVIFDTGSTVFGVFTYKDQLPDKVKKQLPGYYFSQNLKKLTQADAGGPVSMLQVQGSSLSSSAPSSIAMPTSFAAVAGLFAANAALVGLVVVVSRRVRRKGYVEVEVDSA